MTKTEAAARRRRVVDLVNAISNLERDDLHHVLTKNNTTREWLENDLKKINRIVADHHPDEFAEARSRIWETVLLGILIWPEQSCREVTARNQETSARWRCDRRSGHVCGRGENRLLQNEG